MHARRVDGVLDVHAEIDHVQNDLRDRRRDARAAGSPDRHEQLAVLEQDRRRHRREGAFARCDGVGLALHKPEHVRRTGFGREVVHFVVEEKAEARHRDAVAVAAVERVGDRYRISSRIDDRVMSRLELLGADRPARLHLRTWRRAFRVDRGAELREVGLVEETGNRVLHEVRVADVLVAVGVRPPHGFGLVVNR